MRPPKVLDAVVGLTALALATFGGAVAAHLTDTHDVACFNAERKTWDAFFTDVTVRRDGDWLVMRRGFPPHVVGRYHTSIMCIAVLSGMGQ